MPGCSRKEEVFASQAELHSVEKQNLLLTPEIQVVPEPQQKVGENEGLAHSNLVGSHHRFTDPSARARHPEGVRQWQG